MDCIIKTIIIFFIFSSPIKTQDTIRVLPKDSPKSFSKLPSDQPQDTIVPFERYRYVTVTFLEPTLITKGKLLIDYGDKEFPEDPDGEHFEKVVDFLDYMGKYGWRLINFLIKVDGKISYEKYILEKKY